ncbi:MAG: hypothetical protein JKY81_01730 [Colwellia sp.]|nr:hypothetical protein [Colwellia sp.]
MKEASQLSGTLLSTKRYVVDGFIDMGSTQITVPQGGLTLCGQGFNITGLFSSNTSYTMFIDDGVFSGDLFLDNIDIRVDGTGSQVFDLDNAENSNALELDKVNFTRCKDLGLVDNYRQILMTGMGFVYFGASGVVKGLTIDGAMSGGMTILTSITLGQQSGVTLFQGGASLSIGGSLRSDMNALSIDDASVVFNFEAADFVNDSSFFLDSFRTNTSAAGAITGILASDRKAEFRNCIGIASTHKGGVWTVSSASTTTIATINTPVKMAGTTTYSILDHFTQSANNAIESLTTERITMDVTGSITVTGNNGDTIGILLRHWDDSASAYVNLTTTTATFTDTVGPMDPGAENVTVYANVIMDISDRIEVWLENQTGTDDITAAVGSRLNLSERPS